MRKLQLGGALIVALVCHVALAHGQRATERFIPLGRSPGVSGKSTAIGTIVAVDAAERRIHLAVPAGRVSVQIRDSTWVWIDRHERGLSTTTGSFEDCREGRTAEVKYADPDTRQIAEWVKLRIRDPGP